MDEGILFNEELHTYTRKKSRYTSVTQLIGKYEAPFDTEYWSLYKAIKEVFLAKGLWERYKRHVGGWQAVVPYYLEHGSKHEAEVTVMQNTFKAKWIAKNKTAVEKGSATHKLLEDGINSQRKVVFETYKLTSNKSKYIPLQDFTSEQIFTEPFVWDDEYKIAGQSDLIIKIGNRIRIKDYKTNEKLTFEPFNGETYLSPIDYMPRHKYNTYCLQLSLYGYMLERWGFTVEDLELLHITDNGVEPIKCHYYREEAKLMLEHHKLSLNP